MMVIAMVNNTLKEVWDVRYELACFKNFGWMDTFVFVIYVVSAVFKIENALQFDFVCFSDHVARTIYVNNRTLANAVLKNPR